MKIFEIWAKGGVKLKGEPYDRDKILVTAGTHEKAKAEFKKLFPKAEVGSVSYYDNTPAQKAIKKYDNTTFGGIINFKRR